MHTVPSTPYYDLNEGTFLSRNEDSINFNNIICLVLDLFPHFLNDKTSSLHRHSQAKTSDLLSKSLSFKLRAVLNALILLPLL